uniref:Mytimacin-5 n=1 Tax=Mytilus galloprovincialis TaxID=29158 RepID=X2D2W4_MYTGA|nr:Mytimacin-5 [Mytilus galloprovincialis]
MKLFAFSLCLLVFVFEMKQTKGGCWATWSRCSGWSSIATGHLWLDCNTCCKCKGKSGGSCHEVHSDCFLSDTAMQCQCHHGALHGSRPSACSSMSNLDFSCDNKH